MSGTTSEPEGQPVEQQQAEDNERLRRLAAAELAAMRVELTRALGDRVELHQDLNSLAERLSQQEEQTIAAKAETDAMRAELAHARDELASAQQARTTARAELASLHASIAASAPTPRRRWTRVIPKPLKQAVKKAVGRGTK